LIIFKNMVRSVSGDMPRNWPYQHLGLKFGDFSGIPDKISLAISPMGHIYSLRGVG
jgi:hypothetical protein